MVSKGIDKIINGKPLDLYAQYYGTESNYDDTDVYSIPFVITRRSVMDLLEEIVPSFVSHRDVRQIDFGMMLPYRLLEEMMERKPDEAKATGREMIGYLRSVDTDDDCFPKFEIGRICDIIGEKCRGQSAGLATMGK